MKALDTPVLLGLLHGSPSARSLVRSLSGEELATTELNFAELEAVARSAGPKGYRERARALERLRHRLTVLPIGSSAIFALQRRRMPANHHKELALWLMFGALEAAGCSELISETGTSLPPGRWRFKIRRVSIYDTQ